MGKTSPPGATGLPRGPGRPAAATREDVVEAALHRYLRGQRVDVQAIVAELGISRTSVYRWFGSRELLIGEILALTARRLFDAALAEASGSGPERLLDIFDRFNRGISTAPALRTFVARERDAAVRIITDGQGVVQPRLVEWISGAIRSEQDAGAYEPPLDADTLGYAIDRLAEAFLFVDATPGMTGDVSQLRDVEATLLGVPSRRG
jgi:AcrR family transcriptional regulator